MYTYIVYCFYIFFIVLEVFVLLYLIRGILPFGIRLRYYISYLAAPMIELMQKITRHSIMNCFRMDISPYVLLIVLSFLQQICIYLLKAG